MSGRTGYALRSSDHWWLPRADVVSTRLFERPTGKGQPLRPVVLKRLYGVTRAHAFKRALEWKRRYDVA